MHELTKNCIDMVPSFDCGILGTHDQPDAMTCDSGDERVSASLLERVCIHVFEKETHGSPGVKAFWT